MVECQSAGEALATLPDGPPTGGVDWPVLRPVVWWSVDAVTYVGYALPQGVTTLTARCGMTRGDAGDKWGTRATL